MTTHIYNICTIFLHVEYLKSCITYICKNLSSTRLYATVYIRVGHKLCSTEAIVGSYVRSMCVDGKVLEILLTGESSVTGVSHLRCCPSHLPLS